MTTNKSILNSRNLEAIVHLPLYLEPSSPNLFNIAINRVGFLNLYSTADANTVTETEEKVVDFVNFEHAPKSQEICDLFYSFFQNLSFVEWSNFFNSDLFNSLFDQNLFLKNFKIPNNQKTLDVLKLSENFNSNLKKWLCEKKIKPQDLFTILELNENSKNELLLKLCDFQLSKIQSIQALELIVELNLMGTPINELVSAHMNEQWLNELKTKRYPQSSDHPLKKMNLKWPYGTSAQFQRNNDRAGFQVNFFVTNSNELAKFSNQLISISQQWSSNEP